MNLLISMVGISKPGYLINSNNIKDYSNPGVKGWGFYNIEYKIRFKEKLKTANKLVLKR